MAMRDSSGQATIEWVGVVLVAALVLGALAASRGPARDHELGTELAKRISCAAAGAACAKAPLRRSRDRPAGAGTLPPPPPAGGRNQQTRAAKAVDAFRRLRGVGQLTKRIWIACLGYRRFIYERDHPRAPTEAMPLEEALEIANVCLNPLAFLGDD
jgi:hypothetical protein